MVAAAYPRFVCKRALRMLSDLPLPNRLFNVILGTAALRIIASSIYFHRRDGAYGGAAEGDSEGENLRSAAD